MILIFAGARSVRGLVRGLEHVGRQVRVEREADLGSMQSVRAAVKACEPAAVVLAAGLDDPEACESEPDRAFAENAERAINVAAATLEFRSVPVMLSTAEVYGQSGGPWSEADAPEPPSVFAQSKLRGEQFLARAAPNALILRTGPVLEDGLDDFGSRLQMDVEAADDELVSPIGGVDLGRALHALLEAEVRGVVHVANRGAPVSRADLLLRVAEALGIDRGRIAPRPGRALERRAGWARTATLHTDRLDKALDAPLRSWPAALLEAAQVDGAVSVASAGSVADVVAPGVGQGVEVFTPHPRGAEFGTELVVAEAEDHRAQVMAFDAGKQLPARRHRTARTLHVLEGKVLLDVQGAVEEDHVLRAGRSVTVEGGTTYRLTAVDAASVLMIWGGAEDERAPAPGGHG